MSFFDQPYYALTKAHMSRIGVWPEQSKCVRIFRSLTMLTVILTIIGPVIIGTYGAREEVNTVLNTGAYFLSGIILVFALLHNMLKADKMKLMLEKIEGHWKMFKNTSGVIVLDKYAERGRYIITIYSICTYATVASYFVALLLPPILDFVDPLNATRSKYYIFEAEYAVDPDKYYWLIHAHSYIALTVSINILVAVEAMYILLAVHACGLFELVGFQLKLVTSKYTLNKTNAVTVLNDDNYKKTCHCIDIHKEAISFADWIEHIYSGLQLLTVCIVTILITMTTLTALINIGHPGRLLKAVIFNISQVINLYLTSIPGQKLIDHSRKIHTIAYDLDWYDLPVKTQKLLILILMRSNRPCQFTAGKVCVLSTKAFGSIIRTSLSYFMIFAQLL